MKIPMNPDKKDPVWNMFSKILKLIDSRTFQEELARDNFTSTNKHQLMLKLVLLSIFFQLDLSYVYDQVESREKLRKFLNINDLLSLKQIREIYHRNDESKYLELCLKTLNKMQFNKIRYIKTIILDSTSITLDLKFNGKYLSKQSLLTKAYKRAFSTNNGHYAGFKMTLAIDERTCKPLAILIHPGSPHDTKIFDEILHELKRRRILKKMAINIM
ncbi:transposase [Methanobrevibacter arboriphilus]|uniref:transposase n=1 Tax=Methanobrevibacter arboriphilus TaxID=39441 RepID=UPI000A6033D9|nr:transposase [Methanobrevibacter arboriphilus]